MKAQVKVEGQKNASAILILEKLKDYQLLIKMRLTATVVFSSVMAYLIATPKINWIGILTLTLGGGLVTGAANALNQVLEKDYDRLMKRTANRPMAANRMSISEGVIAAGFMCMFGITFLAFFNPWTSFLGMLAMTLYAFVYTPLKRISSIAVFVGAIAGALPVLIGGVAASGKFTALALVLFSIQFFWQFPHFWSIGWLGFEDYRKAGYVFIPVEDNQPSRTIGMQAFLNALFLLVTVFLPYLFGIASIWATIILGLLSLCFAYFSWVFYKNPTRKSALSLMFFSLAYIPVALSVLFFDKIF